MKSNKRKIISIIIVVILFIIIIFQAVNVKHDFKTLSKPTSTSRKFSKLGIYKRITVKDFSKKYKMPVNTVFEFLQIKPQPGDEKLSLLQLEKKYNKTSKEMKANVKRLLDYANGKGTKE